MIQIKCSIKGCPNVFKTNQPVSKMPSFICSGRGVDGYPIPGHTRRDQCEASGRIYDARKDNQDAEVAFQAFQFDPELAGRKRKHPKNSETTGVKA